MFFMKKRVIIIIIVIIVLILFTLLFVRLTGFSSTEINSCQDSDGGKNYVVRGEVFGEYYFLSRETFHKSDVCIDKWNLLEYYCIEDKGGLHSYEKFEKYECPLGCKNGRCLQYEEGIEVPKKISFWQKIKRIFVGKF